MRAGLCSCAKRRQAAPTRRSGPLQLDLFEPGSAEHSYQVFLTNNVCSAKAVLLFHHGRGSQEGLIGEAKKSAMMDYIPTRSRAGHGWVTRGSLREVPQRCSVEG